MLDLPSFTAVAIREGDPECGFECGDPALDGFFRENALPNAQHGFGGTFVLPRAAEDDPSLPVVLGFYTLSMAEMDRGVFAKLLPRKQRQGLPRFPLPASLIGRLAVDRRAQRRGLGELLLLDAFSRAVWMRQFGGGGGVGVLVDAKNELVERRFYAPYGFVTLNPAGEFPRRMFVRMETVVAALAP